MEAYQRKIGILLSYTLTFVNVIVGFIYIPLLIGHLGQNEYGLFQLMGSILIYLSLFDFGLSTTVTRFYSKYIALNDIKNQENVLAISTAIYLFLSVVLAICGYVFYFYLEKIFSSSLSSAEIISAKKMYIVILFIAVITIATSVFNSIINAHERFIFLRLLSIIQTIMRPILVFAVFTVQANALIVVSVQAFLILFGIILKVYYSVYKLKVKIKMHYFDKCLFKEMIKYSFFIFITALMDQIFWQSDQIILGIILGTTSVAVYSIASQIILYYMTLSTSMSSVFLPNITKRVMNKASDSELSQIFVRMGRIQYILLGAVFSGFILFGKDFIFIWVGEGFLQSYYIALIIMIPFTIDLIQNIGLTVLQAKNMYKFRALVFFFMSITNVIFSIPLAIHFGGIGTAIATGVSYLIGNGLIMNVYYLKKVNLDIFIFWKQIFKLSIPIFFSVLIGIFIQQINFHSVTLTFAFKTIIYSIIYFSLMWVIGMNRDEKNIISNFLKVLCSKVSLKI